MAKTNTLVVMIQTVNNGTHTFIMKNHNILSGYSKFYKDYSKGDYRPSDKLLKFLKNHMTYVSLDSIKESRIKIIPLNYMDTIDDNIFD